MHEKFVINSIYIPTTTTTTTVAPQVIIINSFSFTPQEKYYALLQEEFSYFILQDDIEYSKILLDNN